VPTPTRVRAVEGHKHTREQILAGALDTAVSDGLSRLTFGRVAKRLGINDRIVVYYFPTKDELITAVLVTMGEQVQGVLARAFTTRAEDHVALAKAAWPVLARPEIDPVFSLYFEASGLAAAGMEPFRTLASRLVEGWAAWLTDFFDGDPERRRVEAEAAIAVLDGLLLLRQLAGPAAADRAATRLGVR
jgi:AcrR family transcriptional regulator